MLFCLTPPFPKLHNDDDKCSICTTQRVTGSTGMGNIPVLKILELLFKGTFGKAGLCDESNK